MLPFRPLCLLLEITERIPRVDALAQVQPQKSVKTSQAFILDHVGQLVNQEAAVFPVGFLDENTIPQGHANGLRRVQTNRLGCTLKQPTRRWNFLNCQQSNPVRMPDAQLASSSKLRVRKRHALSEDD